MDIAARKKEHTLYIAIVTLAILGLALAFSTWQLLRTQRRTIEEHLMLSSRAVLQSVEGSMRRNAMMQGRLSPDTYDFLQDLQNNDDLLYAGIIDAGGTVLYQQPGQPGPVIVFPPGILGEHPAPWLWQGVIRFNNHPAFTAIKRIPQPGQRRMHTAPHMQHRGNRGEEWSPQAADEPSLFLFVVLDMDKHQAANTGFRRTALFQIMYTLAAAIFLWVLAARFLSRRELAGKAVFLERFQSRLIDNLPDGLLIMDEHGVVQAANPAAEAITGFSAGRLIGRESPIPPPAFTSHAAAVLDAAAHSPVSGSNGSRHWRQIRYNGSLLEVLHVPFTSEMGGNSCMVILRDRTQIHSLEKSLAEAEKLAAVGTLAAGVAHEIRNPLSALRGFAQYFAKKLAGKDPEEEYAKTMVREADRLNKVITDLLYLSHPRGISPQKTALLPLAHELEALLRFDLEHKGVSIQKNLLAEELYADREQLKQALLNLLLNALEAMPAYPAATPGPADEIYLASEQGSHGVWIRVTDTGPGMTEEQQNQAFEPFFTTKSKGTGLGLALVHTTMREHGGTVRIESAPGAGCTISLFFPEKTP